MCRYIILISLIGITISLDIRQLAAGDIIMQDNYISTQKLLKKELGKKQAIVWYLHHSGFAIKTQNHFLIFDYCIDSPAYSVERSLGTGVISPEEIEAENVFVFVSHSHADHYNSVIASWQNSIKNIRYIVSKGVGNLLSPELRGSKNSLIVMEPGQSRKINSVEVRALNSTDLGIAFVVKVDGLVIYHAGDLAWWDWQENVPEDERKQLEEDFKKYVAELESYSIDIAFMPTGCLDKRLKAVECAGALWVVRKYKPKVAIPMHADGEYEEHKCFIDELTKCEVSTKSLLITRRGQCFFYENGKVVDIPASLSISKEDTEGDKDLVQKQSFNKAVAQMKKELEIDPTNLGTIFRLMYYYLNSPESVGGGKEKAIEEAEAIKKQNTAAGHCALAMIFAHEKNYKQAENEYLKAIEINPTNVKPMYYLGYLYQENKQYEKAVSTFEKILMIDSTEINAYYQIGRTSCFSHKNLDRAEECFKKYIEKYIETNPEKGSPSIDMAHWRLGIIYKLQGKKDFAVKEFKKALALNPNNKWAKNALKEVQDE